MNCRPYSTSPRRQRWWQRGALALGTVALLGLPAAQAQFVIIGTDAATTAGSGSDPVDDYFNYMRYQTVYTAAQLSGAGMPAGDDHGPRLLAIQDNGPPFPPAPSGWPTPRPPTAPLTMRPR
ncbi:MAG: hypothetical protein IPG35_09735 [Flavobacteriales bacterium]|nr:hypothetical protein [Flavobacteriales bacterium]